MRILLPLLVTCFCSLSSADTEKLEILKEDAPFPGYLYRPKGPQTYPAIVLLHGSKGGNGDFYYRPGNKPKRVGEEALVPRIARSYAKRGYVTLALCYFDCKHHSDYSNYPPDELVNVDIEAITARAIQWLRQSRFVGGKKVGLWGVSRGAEQAFLLASLIDSSDSGHPDAVVALSPSDRTVRQFSKEAANTIIEGGSPEFEDGPAWRSGNSSVESNHPIRIESYTGPLMVTYFSTDYVWGKRVQVNRSIFRFIKGGVPFSFFSFGKGRNPHAVLKNITSSKANTLFIKLNSLGHGFPKRSKDPDAFRLQHESVSWFFDKTLRN